MAESGCLRDGHFHNLEVGGSFSTPYFFSYAGAPLSGTTEGTFRGTANPGAQLMDTSGCVLYINEGTLASPYWTPITMDQPGIKGLFTDFRDGSGNTITNTVAEEILKSGLRVFGQGLAEASDSGLPVTAVAEIGFVASMETTDATIAATPRDRMDVRTAPSLAFLSRSLSIPQRYW